MFWSRCGRWFARTGQHIRRTGNSVKPQAAAIPHVDVEMKNCLRDPIPEIYDAARYVDAAVSAHLNGRRDIAAELFRMADMPAIRDWVESLWGKGGPWSHPVTVSGAPAKVPKEQRLPSRMPNKSGLAALIARDGFHCRFCGIPVVRAEVRTLIHREYPDAVPWETGNANQHAGFQALWLTYDHLLPHSRGGSSELDNMVVACQPCNCGRSERTLGEVGLDDPRHREPIRSTWDGLERFC
jgi:5-methylcytosine-specific restriction endonuclease McrA